ncbi:MAG: DNA translocase FtsK [uncultured Solirubrobacteraceae bacterium]|uniref:DNA translocase FtsK n=1 Tax=uncultured Solirubrobacteraceae bacterium TaxID=1162706 RepID=A0A6J4SCC8_9ACTN|nr:MAG: DNA translocase FtsK [uncultured Solirubrobacteraceae bacterium]
MATRTAGNRPRARARRSAPARPHLPHLEQAHLDLIALGLAALAIFLAFVIHLRWDGGTAGDGLVAGLRWLIGGVHVLIPAALMASAAIIALRPVLPAVRPFRAGGVCLLIASTLGLAAGTFGFGPDALRPAGWDADWMRSHGGVVGEVLYRGISALFSDLGAHIVAIALLVAGILLLTGASVAGVLQRTGRSVTHTHRKLRDSTSEVRTSVTRRREAARELRELEESAQPTVRSLRSGAEPAGDGFWSGHDRYPDVYGTEDDDRPESPDGGPAKPPTAERPPKDESFFPDPGAFEDIPATSVPSLPGPESDLAEPPAAVPARGLETGDGADTALRPPGMDDDQQPPDADGPRLAEDPVTDEPGVTRAAGRPDPADLTPQGRYRASVLEDPAFQWLTPDPRLLTRSSADAVRPDTGAQEKVAAQLIEALGHFGVAAQVVGMVAGPHITRYELRLAPGIKVAKVAQLKDDLAYSLASADIRILAPIPGKQAVGVEVPNAQRRTVHLGDVYQAPPEDWSPLTVWLGKDVAGRAIGADLAKMPHLLVAGTTGAGKSGAINAMLSSILLRATPHEVRMVLVDPKQVELTHYDSIPHLLTPVITSPKKAATALQNLVREMERRYGMMSLARTRTLPELNRVRASRDETELPYVLCVIDELADLMMVAPADVEDSIIRLAQKARAVGIHLVLATQSPRVDVITGMIKANVPSRIAFAVSSQTDSRVILDQNGAETLLGQGDMLFAPVGSSRLQRIQGAYIAEPEIARLTEAWRRQGEPEFREELLEEPEEEAAAEGADNDGFDPDEDPLLQDAVRLVAEMQTASTSMLQRRLRLGYTRAGRLIDMLERRGVISGYEGSKPRQVLVSEADLPRVLAALGERGSATPPVEAETLGVEED